MNIIKRDGTVQEFNRDKIINAVLSAFKDVDGTITTYALQKAQNIADYIEGQARLHATTYTVEEIQDLVERGLMSLKQKDAAKAYILYREERSKERAKNSKIIRAVWQRNSATNVENSNANVDERSFSGREKEASSDIQKIIALDYTLSKEVSEAHRSMLLYQHDLEKTNLGVHNCFGREVSFITDKGVKTFGDFQDGEEVTILSPCGYWTKGVVRKYGQQKLNSYKLKKNRMEVIIRATTNHRWINFDGDFQEGLKIGDKLFDPPFHWKDFDFEELSEEGKKYWCYGFVMGDGTLQTCWSKKLKQWVTPGYSKVKLCGEKAKFLPYFQQCGWGLKCFANEPEVCNIPFNKNIPNFDSLPLEYLIAFIHGLYEADGTQSLMSNGAKQIYSLQSSNKEICDFIEKYFANAGLYITSIKDLTGQETDFGTKGYTKNYSFQGEYSNKYHWTVRDISMGEKEEEVWCLEVPDGHAFVLNYGIPTGNCLNIDFEKLFREGFSTRNGDIRPPASFATACQLVAVIFQCQSQVQFG